MTALYTGSFDPVHRGHLDIIEQAARAFSHVVVGVLTNPRKTSGLLEPAERRLLVGQAVRHLPNVSAVSFDGLTVDLARRVGAAALVRAAHKEARNEWAMAAMNSRVGGVPTVFVAANPATMMISSSTVRSLLLDGSVGAAQQLVPASIRETFVDLATPDTLCDSTELKPTSDRK